MPFTMAAKLTPTSILLNPKVAALGTKEKGISVQEVAIKGATKARLPPFTVTFGLPMATAPWSPGYGSGGSNNFTHIDQFVKEEKLPLNDFQIDSWEVVSVPVTSFTKDLPTAPRGSMAEIKPMAMLANMVNIIRTITLGTLVMYRFQYDGQLLIVGGFGK